MDQCPLMRPRDSTPIRGDANAKRATRRQNLGLDSARQERVLDLQIGDRVHRLSAPHCVGPRLRQGSIADVSRLHHVHNRADRVLDRHGRVDSSKAVEVNVVCSETAQRICKKILYGGWTPVYTCPATGGIAQCSEFDTQKYLITAAATQSFLEQELVMTHPVIVAGVKQIDTGVERSVDCRNALCSVCRTIEVGHPHAAQAKG